MSVASLAVGRQAAEHGLVQQLQTLIGPVFGTTSVGAASGHTSRSRECNTSLGIIVRPKGEIDLQATVATLFEQQSLQSILHLIGDYREATGMGESEFVRGACWVGPIAAEGATA